MLRTTNAAGRIREQSKQISKSKSLALALVPTENQIFMACLDAHLYEIEYMYLDNNLYIARRTSPCKRII
jgi:hypothetical protein